MSVGYTKAQAERAHAAIDKVAERACSAVLAMHELVTDHTSTGLPTCEQIRRDAKYLKDVVDRRTR